MEMNEFIKQTLPMVMQFDRRLQVCWEYQDDKGEWTHSIKKCPKCQAEWIVSGCPELSTD
jgi:predicted Zn-ribbon and HTH transcriptional regulator